MTRAGQVLQAVCSKHNYMVGKGAGGEGAGDEGAMLNGPLFLRAANQLIKYCAPRPACPSADASRACRRPACVCGREYRAGALGKFVLDDVAEVREQPHEK